MMVETTENLFDGLVVTIVGFQTETYKRIMGMNIEKTEKRLRLIFVCHFSNCGRS